MTVHPIVLARSAFVQPEVKELQSRIGQGGHSGVVQMKLVRVVYSVKPFEQYG